MQPWWAEKTNKKSEYIYKVQDSEFISLMFQSLFLNQWLFDMYKTFE